MRRNRVDGVTVGVVLFYVFVILINFAWIGTLIWALIYGLTHMDGWLN